MAPFTPLDSHVQWDISPVLETTRGYGVVLGSGARYESFLFVLTFKTMNAGNLLGAGCTENFVDELLY